MRITRADVREIRHLAATSRELANHAALADRRPFPLGDWARAAAQAADGFERALDQAERQWSEQEAKAGERR